MPTHREILQNQADTAGANYLAAAAESERIYALVKEEQAAIESLTAEHSEACRKLATGQPADTSAILAEKARRGDRLQGLESLYKEATEKLGPLNAAHVQASQALTAELDREELARLEEVITAANQKASELRAALKDAEQVATNAVWARSRHMRQTELKQKSIA